MDADQIIQKLKNTIEKGIYGIDYTVIPRWKNRCLRRDYVVNDNDIVDILSRLTSADFEKTEPSKNSNHLNDTVAIFKKTEMLLPKWMEDAEKVFVTIYIKITWPEEEKGMLIISFHEDNI